MASAVAATIRFEYRRYRNGWAPIIPLKVLSGGRWLRVNTYVDSGASYSIIKLADARRLGLMRVKARRIIVTTSGGKSHGISLHRLWVKLGAKKFSITFGVPRGFDVDHNLLGRKDFFSRYKVCFDDCAGILTFTPNKSS